MGNGIRKAQFDRMLSEITDRPDSSIASLMSSMFGDGLVEESVSALSLADQWSESVDRILHMVPEALSNELEVRYHDFRHVVKKVYKDHEIHGTVTDHGEPGDVFISFSEMGAIQAGCTHCDLSPGALCCHIAGFVDFLDDQLDGRRSKLRTDINKEKFAKGKPNRDKFEVDNSKRVLRDLKLLVSVLPTTATDDTSDEALPAIAAAPEQRIGWSFQMDTQGLTLDAMLQQKKKRGIGFTKGRKVSPEKLRTDRKLPISKADQRVVDCIELIQERYYSSGHYELSPMDALDALVGEENVLLNGQLCRVTRGTPVLMLGTKDDGLLGFQLVSPWKEGRDMAVLFKPSQMATVDAPHGRICYSQCDESSISAIRTLLSVPPFSTDSLDEVLKQIDVIRPFVSIRLPESVGGPIVKESTKPVVILRSRSDGKLDYGIRVRTESGKLKRPGAPMLVCIEKRGGKRVQLVRDADAEHAMATQLLQSLGLTNEDENWFGTLDDFQAALHVIERLQSGDLDVEVLWDKGSEKPIKVLGSLSSKNVRVDIASKRNWFGITGECKFGNQSMPLTELLANLPTGDETIGDFISLGDGGWAKINDKLRERLKRLRDATHSERKALRFDATAAPAIRDLIEDDVEIRATKAWEKSLKRFAKAESLVPTVPENLDANLRDYQIEGYQWLSRLAAWGVGGILADDMGLGKTLQALAVLLDRAADGPALVIGPTSVGFNWVREAQRFAPDLDVHLYRETDRADFLSSVGPGTLVICSYGLALRDAESLAAVDWNTMVLDEAQAIKNSRSKTSRAIASIDADWTVALTGTPVENHLGELWSLFQVVSPGVFGGWEQFRSRYATPIEKMNDEDARNSLAARLQPFVLRRTKSEVLTELPPRTEMNLYVDLSPAERAEYEKVRLAAIGEIDEIESLPQVQDQRFKILAMLTRLRQISCHAGLVNKNWTDSSAKLDQLCQTLESLREEGHRALVFSQFTSHLALIRKAMDERGFTYEYLDGSTPAKARQVAVDRFQDGDANAFLISLKAGGTGLNLTAADYVIHMDPWWNPAVEDQATDRAHRYGQDKPVMVYRIVARGTIEEEILALHESKRDLVAGVMKGTQAAAKLTNEDLMRMMRGND